MAGRPDHRDRRPEADPSPVTLAPSRPPGGGVLGAARHAPGRRQAMVWPPLTLIRCQVTKPAVSEAR
jgi:hypothetical protein